MRRSLVTLGIAVVVGAVVVVVAVSRDRAVAGMPVAGRQDTAPGPATPLEPVCDGGPQLLISGSALASVAADQLVSTYEAACPNTTVTYEAVGTGAGIQRFLAGETGMATTDRPLTAAERKNATERCEIQQLPFVAQPVAIHYRLPVGDQLTLDAPTLTKIFTGAITRWDDPAIVAMNPDVDTTALPITVVGRSTESTVTAVFQSYLTAVGGWTGGSGTTFTGKATQLARSETETLSIIQNTDGAIGYLLPDTAGRALGMRLDGWAPDLSAVAEAVDLALPADGLELNPDTLYRVKKGYPLVVLSYAVFCANDPAARDFLRCALVAEPNPISYLFPAYEWATRFANALQ